MRYGWITCCCVVLLLLAFFSGTASSRRAGRRGSPPQGEAHSTLKSNSKQSQSRGGHGAKMAGLAAMGAAMGYGLNYLGKSHYGHSGHSSPLGVREKGLNSSGVMVNRHLHSGDLRGPGLPALSLLVCGLTTSLFQN